MAITRFTVDDNVIDTRMNQMVDEVSLAIGQIANPPININPDFKIWQRYNSNDATTFTNPVNKYIADRYRANGTGTMKPVTNGAEIIGTINIKYILEDADFQKVNGKTLTRSWSENGVIQKETFVCNSATIFDKTITNKTVNFIKIELGEIATPLSPRGYGEELALCQRYGVGGQRDAILIQRDNNNLWFKLILPVEFRAWAISFSNVLFKMYDTNGLELSALGFIFLPVFLRGNTLLIQATKLNHGINSTNVNLILESGFIDNEIY